MTDTQSNRSGAAPRKVVALMMTLSGALFFFVFLRQDIRNMTEVEWADLPWRLMLRYVVAMGLGGAISGWLLAGLFGRRGIGGWFLGILAGVVASVLAGLIGSAIGLMPDLLADGWQSSDLIPIVFGLMVVPMAAAGTPLVGAVWLLLIIVAQHLAARARSL